MGLFSWQTEGYHTVNDMFASVTQYSGIVTQIDIGIYRGLYRRGTVFKTLCVIDFSSSSSRDEQQSTELS